MKISTVFLLVCLVALSVFSTDIYLPSLPEIVKQFHGTVALGQLTLSSYMFGFAFSMLLSGSLSDKYGRKPIIITGLLLHFVGTLLCLISNKLEFLIVARFIQALGGCCGTVLGRVIVKDVCDQNTAVTVLAYIAMGMSISPALAPILGGFLATWFNWHASFLVLLVANATLFTAVIFLLEESNKKPDPSALNLKILWQAYRTAFTNKFFVAYTTVITLSWCGYFAFIASSSFVFIDSLKVRSYEFGFIYSIVVFCYLCGTNFAKKTVSRFHTENMVFSLITLSLLSSLASVLLNIFTTTSTTKIMLPIMFYLFSIGAIMPHAQAKALSPFNKNVGAIGGLLYFIEMLMSAILGVMISLLDHTFVSKLFLPTSIVIFGCALTMFIVFYGILIKGKVNPLFLKSEAL